MSGPEGTLENVSCLPWFGCVGGSWSASPLGRAYLQFSALDACCRALSPFSHLSAWTQNLRPPWRRQGVVGGCLPPVKQVIQAFERVWRRGGPGSCHRAAFGLRERAPRRRPRAAPSQRRLSARLRRGGPGRAAPGSRGSSPGCGAGRRRGRGGPAAPPPPLPCAVRRMLGPFHWRGMSV